MIMAIDQSTEVRTVKDSIRSKNRNSVILLMVSKTANAIMRFASRISPRLNTELRYFLNYGKRIRLNPPITFVEKCNWYKLNIVNKYEIFRTCSDKYAVRDYIIDKGYGEYLNELICTFKNPDEIDFDKLPDKFAMKLNDGAGFYLICTNKKELDYEKERKKFRRWWKVNNYLMYSEMQNRARKRMIVVEKYIDDFENNEQPTDYKFYCFDGEPVAVLVVWGRDVDTKKIFMSKEWEFISYAWKGGKADTNINALPMRPRDLDKMIKCARDLASGFPFVRVDLYQGKDKPIFGELTFTCAGAMFTAETDPSVLNMADLFKVPTDFISGE